MFSFLAAALIRIFWPLCYNATIWARASAHPHAHLCCVCIYVVRFYFSLHFQFLLTHFLLDICSTLDLSNKILHGLLLFVTVFRSLYYCLSSFTENVVVFFIKRMAKRINFWVTVCVCACGCVCIEYHCFSLDIKSFGVFSISWWNRIFQLFQFMRTLLWTKHIIHVLVIFHSIRISFCRKSSIKLD